MISSAVPYFLKSIVKFDMWLFRKINTTWTNSFFDRIMPVITEADRYFGLRIAVLAFFASVAFFGAKKLRIITLVFIIGLGISDLSVNRIFKPAFQRQRPFNSLFLTRLLTRQTRSYSFPSSHAANSMYIAAFIAFLNPAFIPLGLLAALVGYSRIYCGAHYPLDVFQGALLGGILGIFSGHWTKKILKWKYLDKLKFLDYQFKIGF